MKSPLLCIALILPLVTLAANQALQGPPLPAQVGAQLEIFSTMPEVTSISLRNPELVTQELVFDGATCKAAILAGEPFRPEEGSPAVPQVTRLYRIPNTGGVDLVIRNAEFELMESYKPYPYHDPESQEVTRAESFRRDEWYPPAVAEISAPMIFRDFRIVAVTLNPVQVNPVTQQARYYSTLDVDIVANQEPGQNELLNPRTPSARYAPIYRELISNLDESALDETPQLPGGYLILARDNNFTNQWVDSIATWRRLSGYNVQFEQRNNWTASQMRTFIRDVYDNSTIPLEYVTLMGDPQSTYGVPTNSTEFDHYFALANDDDELEDFGVGRYPASSASEFANLYSKLLYYERTPWMEDSLWFQRGLFAASTTHQLASNERFVRWADQQFRMHTCLDSNVFVIHTGQLPIDPVITLLDDGVGLFLWRGSWIGEIGSDFPGRMQPTRRLPICGFYACGEDVIAKAFVLAGTSVNPKGAVAAIGVATAGSHAAGNITTAGGLAYALANMHVEHLGHALNASKIWLFRAYGETDFAMNHSRWTSLAGDPALRMWTEIPSTIAVDYPLTLPVGAHGVELQVTDSVTHAPISEAVVVLWKGNFENPEIYTRALTDDSGRVCLPIAVSSAGDLRLCVTKHNHKPYLINIPCNSVAQQISVESVLVDDNNEGGSIGNGDGLFNPGETIDLLVRARNFGSASIETSTSATISCENPLVSIDQPEATFPELASGQTVEANVPFRITLSPMLQNETNLVLTITFDLEGGYNLSSQSYSCFGPDVAIVEINGLSEFGPGRIGQLQITLLNSGQSGLTNVIGELISLTPYIRVMTTSGSFGDIIPQSTQTTGPFQIVADSAAFRGQRAEVLLAIVDDTGFRDSACFEITVGDLTENDPSGPDAYGYYAYDQSDLSYENCPAFDYLDISNGLGEDLEIDDTGESEQPDVVWSRLVELPFSFTYYGATYDTITVCSNGWLAFGNQSWNDCFRNYPLPGILSASNMVAAYWDDLKTSEPDQGVFVYHNAETNRFVIQWKAGAGGQNYDAASLDFQVILLDPAEYASRDGNGKIVLLYNDVQMGLDDADWTGPFGSTVGIQDSGSVIGLQYAYQLDYAPGASNIVDNTTILFTTDGPSPIDTSTSIAPTPTIPQSTLLHPNYPNPFNPTTTIRFDLAAASNAKLTVYDLNGRTVARLIDSPLTAGSHSVMFDASRLSSGVYFYQLQTGAHVEARKMVLLK